MTSKEGTSMNIAKVTDAAFRSYGRVVEGYALDGVLAVLEKTPLKEGVAYVPKDESLHQAAGAEALGTALFGGMPFQFGWCNGYNTRLNCLEYHRDSEFNLGTEDFILLLAKQEEIENGVLDTAKVKAFLVPKGVLVEIYATALHYAPCGAGNGAGFRVMVALPEHTNTDVARAVGGNTMDRQLWARNKWLLAHPDSAEARAGAYVGLKGDNIDIQNMIG